MTSNTRSTVWEGEYYPFGQLYWATVGQPNPHRLPGQYQDNESGLYYNWHRYYDPVTGRYRQADPIGLSGGDINLFQYVQNAPLTWSDRSGLGKSFGSRWRHYFFETNREIARSHRYILSLGTYLLGRPIAEMVDSRTPLQYLWSVLRTGTWSLVLRGVVFPATESIIIVGATYGQSALFAIISLEVGIAIGSAANAGIDIYEESCYVGRRLSPEPIPATPSPVSRPPFILPVP
jgi:RHS repeat-associated protein